MPRAIKGPPPDEIINVAKILMTLEMVSSYPYLGIIIIVKLSNPISSNSKAKEEFYWTKGKISITDEKQIFWYMGYTNYLRTIKANEEIIVDCFNCNAKQVQAKPR